MKSKKMKILLRLYRVHDMDLIALHKDSDFSIQKAVKYALYNYVKGETKKMAVPEIPNLAEKEYHGTYRVYVFLDEEMDAEIIDFLNTIKPRVRNSFIKNLVRYSLIGVNVSMYNICSDAAEKEKQLNEKYFINTIYSTAPTVKGGDEIKQRNDEKYKKLKEEKKKALNIKQEDDTEKDEKLKNRKKNTPKKVKKKVIRKQKDKTKLTTTSSTLSEDKEVTENIKPLQTEKMENNPLNMFDVNMLNALAQMLAQNMQNMQSTQEPYDNQKNQNINENINTSTTNTSEPKNSEPEEIMQENVEEEPEVMSDEEAAELFYRMESLFS